MNNYKIGGKFRVENREGQRLRKVPVSSISERKFEDVVNDTQSMLPKQ